MTLTLSIHSSWSWLHFHITTKCTISAFPIHLRDQIWPCHKIGQGQPRVIIYINFVVMASRCYIPCFKAISLLEKKKWFFKVFTIYGHDSHLGQLTWTIWIILPIHNGFIWNIILFSLVDSKKRDFKLFNPSDLWPRSLKDLDLKHS